MLHAPAIIAPSRRYRPLGASPATAPLGASRYRPLNYFACYHLSGVVVVPYTKSAMSFFELYRMNVPLFYPSVALLTKWELGMPTSTTILTAHTRLAHTTPTYVCACTCTRLHGRATRDGGGRGASSYRLHSVHVCHVPSVSHAHNNHAPHAPTCTHLHPPAPTCRRRGHVGAHLLAVRTVAAAPALHAQPERAQRPRVARPLAAAQRPVYAAYHPLAHPSPTPRSPFTHSSGLLAFWLAAQCPSENDACQSRRPQPFRVVIPYR